MRKMSDRNVVDFPDFLNDDLENFVLSQVAEEIEDDFKLTQIAAKIEEDYAFQNPGNNSENVQPTNDFDLFETALFDLGFLDENCNDRFSSVNVATDDEITNLIDGNMNVNTKKNTKWAVGVFNEWRSFRARNGDVISDLHMMNAETMNYWLERFVMETRKKNGDEYPPKSLYYIVCGLLRHCRDMNVNDKNFLDPKDGRFAHFRRLLDAKMKELLSKGLGTKVRKADPVTKDDEEKLWAKNVFGDTDSTTLQYTVFFYNCKLFGLRGRDEHRNLDHSQFEVGVDANGRYVRFYGRNNKTFQGGLGDLRLENKDIKHYASGKYITLSI